LCLSCNVKKVGKLVRFRQKGQKQASFLAFHKCCQWCLLRGPRYISTSFIVCQYTLVCHCVWLCLFIELFIYIFFLIVHWLMIDHCLVFISIKITYLLTYLSAPSAVHSYRVPGKFIRIVRIKQKFIRIAYLYSKCTDCRINLEYILQYFDWYTTQVQVAKLQT
jgi:hypothetical protein